MVELIRFELMTPCLQSKTRPSRPSTLRPRLSSLTHLPLWFMATCFSFSRCRWGQNWGQKTSRVKRKARASSGAAVLVDSLIKTESSKISGPCLENLSLELEDCRKFAVQKFCSRAERACNNPIQAWSRGRIRISLTLTRQGCVSA